MEGEHAGRGFQPRRQAPQPSHLAAIHLVAGEAVGVAFPAFADPAVMVAAQRGDGAGLDQSHRLARPERAGGDVTEVEDLTKPAPVDIGEDGFEGEEIAMNVGDDGELHGPSIGQQS